MRIVGYIRLSRDDGNDESISVSNQRRIINEYATNHNMNVDEFYIDDGVSGYTFDRPAFNRLKKDLEDDKVDIVIVKDLSRIGRHNAKTLLFIENITKLNKQLIIISDDYNNLEDDDDMIGIKTWFNEKYVKDTSRKVRMTISNLQKTGDWIGTIPYGYKRDFLKKKTFYVDHESSQYVKRIFNMYVQGYGSTKIAKIFQNEGVPTPSQMQNIHRAEVGLDLSKESPNWSSVMIRRILANEFYIGTLVSNKTKSLGIKGKKVFKDKSENYRFENHHEAIIDKSTFELVQQIMKERSANHYRGGKRKISLYTSMIYCGDCGRTLSAISNVQYETYYVCRTYHLYGAKFCNYNKIYEKDVTRAIIVYLRACRDNLAKEIENLDEKIKKELKESQGVSSVETLEVLEKRLSQTNKEIKSLIEQKTKEMIKSPSMSEIIEETYQGMINDKMNYMKTLKEQIESQKNTTSSSKEIKVNLNKALNIFDTIIASDTITREQAQILIERIEVYYNKGMVIKMRGNLNAIVNPNAKVDVDRKTQYYKAIVEKISKKSSFYYSKIHKELREEGYNFGYYRKFKPIMDEFADLGIISRKNNSNQSVKVLKSKDEIFSLLNLYTDSDTDPCRSPISVNVGELTKIGNWIERMDKTPYFL